MYPQRMLMFYTFKMLFCGLLSSFLPGNTFQNLKVSSPAPVTTVLPSGLIARYRTLKVCPVKVDIFYILGYLQTLISFKENPWVDTNSFSVLLKIKLQTCEPVSIDFIVVPSKVFLNLIVLSAVPPPDKRSPCWWGDHVTAFTAATWSLYLTTGSLDFRFQM